MDRRSRVRTTTAGFLLAMVATGCHFSRTVINANARDLDLSFIEIGKTHWQEVLNHLGPPDVPIEDLRTFKYTSLERRQTEFHLGYFLYLPFSWHDGQAVEETLIELDEHGRVEHVVRSRRGTIRPPLESQGSRPALVNEVDQVGSKL